MAERTFIKNTSDTIYPKHTVNNLTDIVLTIFSGTTDITSDTTKVIIGTQGTAITTGSMTRYPFPITFKDTGNFLITIHSATVGFSDSDLNCNVIENKNKDVITRLVAAETTLSQKIETEVQSVLASNSTGF